MEDPKNPPKSDPKAPPGGEPGNPPARDPPPGEPGGAPPADPQPPPPVSDPPSGTAPTAAPINPPLPSLESDLPPPDTKKPGEDSKKGKEEKDSKPPKPQPPDSKKGPGQESVAPGPVDSTFQFVDPLTTAFAGAVRVNSEFINHISSEWLLAGSFNVPGQLTSGSSCCVIGDFRSFKSHEGSGLQLTLSLGTLDISLVGLNEIHSETPVDVTICSPGLPDYSEHALVSIEVDWSYGLICRQSLVESTLGPFSAKAGITTGFALSRISVGEGRSATALFSVDSQIKSLDGLGGTFLGVGCSLGNLRIMASVDYLISGIGDTSKMKDLLMTAVGMGFQF